jgi:hypothetical protein
MSVLSHKNCWLEDWSLAWSSLLWPPSGRQFLIRTALSTLVIEPTEISVWWINPVARAARRLSPGTKQDLRDLRARLDRKALPGLRANPVRPVQPVLQAMKS